MTGKDLVKGVRFQLADNLKNKWSDDQFLDAINSVIRIISVNLCNIPTSTIGIKEVVITSSSFTLPSDFLTVASTKDVDGNILAPIGFDQKVDRYSYKIIDGTIYSDAVNYTLYYRKMFSGLVTLDDALPLDSGFFELLKKYVVVYLLGGYNKSNSVSIDNINKELGSLLQGREFGHISWQLPFSL